MSAVGSLIMGIIARLGYGGVIILMGVESACIPLPSEVIMPFAGSLVAADVLSLWGVSLAGAVGCVLGSLVAYYVGAVGGRRFIERYGRYILITRHDLEMADRWFARHGDLSVFIGRLLPVIRTFIAFPAGVSRMRLVPFVVYTFVGSLIWSFGLAYIGLQLGEHWDSIGVYFHRFDAVIAAAILMGAAWWVWRHVRILRAERHGPMEG